MICKKCSAEYDDTLSKCPECEEENLKPASDGFQKGDMYIQDVQDTELPEEELPVKVYETPEYNPTEAAEEENNTENEKKKSSAAEALPQASERRKLRKVSKTKQEIIAENKAMVLLVFILCLVGAATAFLTAMNIKTDAFEKEINAQKAVALSKLSAEEEAQLEKEIALYFSALTADFDSSVCDGEAFLERINPADKGNIYSLTVNADEPLQTVADPAMRFENENGEYSYYKIESSKVEKLLERFSLSVYGNVNCENYYYHDGFYYFNSVASKNTPVVSADITKSKKVLDGSFYAEGYFYLTNGAETVRSDAVYMNVEKNNSASVGAPVFKIIKADNEALFTDAGNPAKNNASMGYKIEKKIIEGKTNDGKLYCRYIMEYPVFSGDTVGEKAINTFFEGTVSAYELRASNAQKDYESFVGQGGNAQELPFTETVITRVTYSDDDKISFVEKIASYSPEIPEKEEETTTSEESYGYYEEPQRQPSVPEVPEQEPVELFTRTVEGYTFDIKTGDFMVKDDIAGKNYMGISEVLYRIYNSYDYTGILPEKVTEGITDANGNVVQNGTAQTTTEPATEEYYDDPYGYDYGYNDYGYGEEDERDNDGVPEDEYGLGTAIYESACCYTEGGFTFYYVEEDGYVTEVTLPWDVLERFAE